MEQVVYKYRWQIMVFCLGVLFFVGGIFLSGISVLNFNGGGEDVLVVDEKGEGEAGEVVVEISGSVVSPGVYRVTGDARIEDVLVLAGGVTDEADLGWMEKSLNRASRVSDGQKIYIPCQSETVSASNQGGELEENSSVMGSSSGKVNINSASQSALEDLWGIGPVYAQKIIENRPYSNVEELITRGILKNNVYETNKDLLSVY
jgi:DNA uptake protein ComE-like DNA-binding protein